MHKSEKTVDVIIKGRVQGVGFRRFVEGIASRFALYGWVKNLPDGSVRTVLQGQSLFVDQALINIKEGNRFSRVETVQITPITNSQTFSSFNIRF